MIVWLASYPRSGNTLLRTIIKHCFGLDSFTDEAIHVQSPIRSDSSLVGHRDLPAPWQEFYDMATHSDEMFLVKTHLPPRDEQPFVYVVRDGRSAARSYKKYYQSYVPEHNPSIFQIIAGDDAYGDWTSHHDAWVSRPGIRSSILRFEDLPEIASTALQELARFLGHSGPIQPWRNPFEKLARLEPGFFRQGACNFSLDQDWPPLANQVFNALHSRLMRELGYPLVEAPPLEAEMEELLGWLLSLVNRNRELTKACEARLALIDRLSTEAQRRLDIIERISAGTARRS